MKYFGKLREVKSCQGCPVWTQPSPTAIADSQNIKECIRRVLGDKRWWLTAEEFLAQIEAHKLAHDKARLNPKTVNQMPVDIKEVAP